MPPPDKLSKSGSADTLALKSDARAIREPLSSHAADGLVSGFFFRQLVDSKIPALAYS
jgi:hypothetical protein